MGDTDSSPDSLCTLKGCGVCVCLGCVWPCGSVCSVIKRRREGSQIREQSAKPKSRVYHIHHYYTVLHMQKCKTQLQLQCRYQVPTSTTIFFPFSPLFFSSLHIKHKLPHDCTPTHLFFYCIFRPH